MPLDALRTPRYGQHLSKEEVDELVAPGSATVKSLEAWLTYHNIDPDRSLSRTDAGDWVTVTIPIGKAEEMLDTKYGVYKHIGSGETIVRTTTYSLPSVLHEHVSVITPTTYFGTTRTMMSHVFSQRPAEKWDPTSRIASAQDGVPASCVEDITPSCLFALYNATGYVPKATDKNVLGVAGYLKQFANYADLQVCLGVLPFVLRSIQYPRVDLPYRPSSGSCRVQLHDREDQRRR